MTSGGFDHGAGTCSANLFSCQQNSLSRRYFAKATVEDELGVDHTLGDALAVEVGVLLEQLPVLYQQRPAWPGRQRVLVVADGDAGRGGEQLPVLLRNRFLSFPVV